MAESIKFTLGLALTPRTRALFDGSVRPDGIQLRCESKFGDGLDNTGARHRAILGGAIDGGECSTSSLILARMRGMSLRGLPVFPARQFRHRCIYCATTSTLSHPSELKGKRVSAHRYNATTAVWLRALLAGRIRRDAGSDGMVVAEPDVGEEADHAAAKFRDSELHPSRPEPASTPSNWSRTAPSTPPWSPTVRSVKIPSCAACSKTTARKKPNIFAAPR